MMNTNHVPQLLSTTARIAVGIAAVAVIALSSFAAGKASHTAVDVAQAAMHPAVVYVRLQPVEIVGKHITGDDVADSACAAPQTRI